MKRTDLSPLAWLKLLQHTKVCVYLASKPFDWPTLALESIFWGIPTLFSDEHIALSGFRHTPSSASLVFSLRIPI